ncbi:MAG: glycosyltransferase [Elusimicrobiaceae bacterium]|nr:glycosyltransferase [Elusimicrobiaceae bacterium]
MKILYVCTTTDRGGAETALYRLALAAKQEGHEVKIVSLKPLGVLATQLKQAGFSVVSLDLQGKFRPIQTTGALARLLKEIEQFRPDIVHAFLYRAIQLCRLARRKTPFILITSAHYNPAKLSFWKRLIDRGLKTEDTISTAESYSTEQYLINKQKYPSGQVRLISNGIDPTVFAPNPAEREKYRNAYGFSDQEVVFCCVARLSKEKNHQLLLQSFAAVHAKNPQTRLVLVGDGPEKPVLEAFLAKKGLNEPVLWAGDTKDVKPFLWAADVFVLPSLVESLPLALLEASLCGLPAIVSKAGDMPQAVIHGETGFVFNGKDPVLLSALMAELIENKALRQKMGENSRTRTIKKYPQPEKIYLKLYKEVK